MAIEHIGSAAQRFIDRSLPFDLNHNMALMLVGTDRERGAPTPAEIRDEVLQRIAYLPKLTRRLIFPPRGTGRPFLADDPEFDIDYHLRVIEGEAMTEQRVNQIAGEMLERPLDRSRPMFEVHLIYGLEGGRMAIIAKAHHLLLEGVGGWQSLAGLLLDVSAEGTKLDPKPFDPPPLPTRGEAAKIALARRAERTRGVLQAARAAVLDSEARSRERDELLAVPSTIRDELLPAAPELPINVPTGMHRSVAWQTVPLATVKAIAHSLPGHVTVNDVALFLVAEALAAQLRGLGLRDPLPNPRFMVPISVALRQGPNAAFDERDAYMVVDLALSDPDPVARLEAISRQTEERKGAEATVIQGLLEVVLALPNRERALAWNVLANPRMYNVVLSDVRGLLVPLYVRGRRVEGMVGLASLPPRHAVRATALSACSWLTFGFTVDSDVVRDREPLREGVRDGLRRLADAVGVPVDEALATPPAA